jgi:uncharacterized protein involved in outer membrane biogenesis
MFEFIVRCAVVFLAIIGLYAIVIGGIYWEQFKRAWLLEEKYGYTWAIAWDLAGTQIAIDKRLEKIRRAP